MEETPHTRDSALRFFINYTKENRRVLQHKTVIDLSAGSGFISHLFEEAESRVLPFDLFPENNRFALALCQSINLQETLPIASSFADYVILAETIEHLPDQLFLFREVSRILKQGGRLLLTTPNTSSLRSRLAQFLSESEHYGSPPPNEISAHVSWDRGQKYFNKLFISGVLRLRTLAAMNQLKIKVIHPSPRSSTSYFLLFTYPLIYLFAARMRNRQTKKDPVHSEVYKEISKLNTSWNILLSKHLLMEFERQ